MTRSGGALIKLKSIVATLYLPAYSASEGTVEKKSTDEENRNERDSDEGRGGTAGREERKTKRRCERDTFFTINSTRVDCQRERDARESQRHEYKAIAISVMEINEIIGTASM